MVTKRHNLDRIRVRLQTLALNFFSPLSPASFRRRLVNDGRRRLVQAGLRSRRRRCNSQTIAGELADRPPCVLLRSYRRPFLPSSPIESSLGLMGMEVTAGDGVELRDEDDFTDSELVFYVRQALKSVALGDDEDYTHLISIISFNDSTAPDQEALRATSLRALSESVSCIDIFRHRELLHAVFGMSMWQCGTSVMDAFVSLLVSMAASSGKFIDACLETLVNNFCPPNNMLHVLDKPRGKVLKQQVLDRVHSALVEISDLVPLTPTRLDHIVRSRMPRVSVGEALSVIYVENMLKLESGELRDFVGKMMLKALVDSLVELDVEIFIEPVIGGDDSHKGIFEIELEDIYEKDDEEEPIAHEVSRGTYNRHNLDNNAVANKLDSLMVITCEHLRSCSESGRLDEVFETLFESFEMTVMTTIKSKFCQFLLFYVCSLDPEYCGKEFAHRLEKIFLDKGKYPHIRMVAVSYLASYLSRARFLSISFVADMLLRLVNWCDEYCQVKVRDLNPTVFRVFYSSCQAILYIMCFKMRAMIDIPNLRSKLFHMPLKTILFHSLNPLKVCLPSIVEEFLRQAKAAELFDASDRILFSGLLESDLSKAFGGSWRLDTFFPFDPFLLKKTDRYIRPNFMLWSMVKSTYAPDFVEGDEEDDDDDLDVRFGKNGYGDEDSDGDGDVEMDEFESSMNKMSITPGKNTLRQHMPARIQLSTSPW